MRIYILLAVVCVAIASTIIFATAKINRAALDKLVKPQPEKVAAAPITKEEAPMTAAPLPPLKNTSKAGPAENNQVTTVLPEPAPANRAPRRAPVQAPPAGQNPAAPVAVAGEPEAARIALSYVGADPIAETIWTATINDASVAPNDRQNLIEDLNEDGFDDPRNPTIDDLPLIENRLALIEQLAPDAIDDTNASAFAEAYKDLVNMHAKALAQ